MRRAPWAVLAVATWVAGLFALSTVGRGLSGLFLYALGVPMSLIKLDAPAMGAWGYALPVLGILAAHEAGHWIMARWYGLRTTGPFFLPVPLGWGIPFVQAIGTAGAFVHIDDDRRSAFTTFDYAWTGLMTGFAATVALTALGLSLSVGLDHGTASRQWSPGPIAWLLRGPTAWHPVLFAARVGWCVTTLSFVTDGWRIFPAVPIVWRTRRWELAGLACVAYCCLGRC